jgi:hypothetical protein
MSGTVTRIEIGRTYKFKIKRIVDSFHLRTTNGVYINHRDYLTLNCEANDYIIVKVSKIVLMTNTPYYNIIVSSWHKHTEKCI